MKNFAGTVRQNRTVGVPLPTKTEAARSMIRGTMKATYNDEICLAVWRDSQPVYLASNFWGLEPVSTCQRYAGMLARIRDTLTFPAPSLCWTTTGQWMESTCWTRATRPTRGDPAEKGEEGEGDWGLEAEERGEEAGGDAAARLCEGGGGGDDGQAPWCGKKHPARQSVARLSVRSSEAVQHDQSWPHFIIKTTIRARCKLCHERSFYRLWFEPQALDNLQTRGVHSISEGGGGDISMGGRGSTQGGGAGHTNLL